MKSKPVYIMLHNKDPERDPIHVPVVHGELITDKHGFVVPMRPYEGMRTLSVDVVLERFECPRTL